MPQLIKNIQGNLLDSFTSDLILINSVIGEAQQEDYIELFGFNGYLQNLTRAEETQLLTKPLLYGLQNNKNLRIITLNIDY